jgi:hypothetical protein
LGTYPEFNGLLNVGFRAGMKAKLCKQESVFVRMAIPYIHMAKNMKILGRLLRKVESYRFALNLEILSVIRKVEVCPRDYLRLEVKTSHTLYPADRIARKCENGALELAYMDSKRFNIEYQEAVRLRYQLAKTFIKEMNLIVAESIGKTLVKARTKDTWQYDGFKEVF